MEYEESYTLSPGPNAKPSFFSFFFFCNFNIDLQPLKEDTIQV